MKISKRLLTKWRKEALRYIDYSLYDEGASHLAKSHQELTERILLLTQELIDQKLLEEVNK